MGTSGAFSPLATVDNLSAHVVSSPPGGRRNQQRQIAQVFTGQVSFLSLNRQYQSTAGKLKHFLTSGLTSSFLSSSPDS